MKMIVSKKIELLFLFLAIFCCGMYAKKRPFPNILLISLDSCRADHLASYGYKRDTSPFLSEIARNGTQFSLAFCNGLPTTPSHTTILTSLFQESHKVEFFGFGPKVPRTSIPPRAKMIQEILKENGYLTIGIAEGPRMSREYGFDRGFAVYDDQRSTLEDGSDRLIELIKMHRSDDQPIFAFLHTYQTHAPYISPAKYELFGKFASPFVSSIENLLKYHGSAASLSKNDIERIIASYDAKIRFADDLIKALFQNLEKEGFFNNYLLVITADHGEEFGEHGGLIHRENLYDELLHVPLIIAGTRVEKNKVAEQLVSSIDILPTILAYAGIKASSRLMGEDILADKKHERDLYSQIRNLRYAIRTSTMKFILNRDSRSVEIFDLLRDPHETNNIAAQEPALVSSFMKKLSQWRKTLPKNSLPSFIDKNMKKSDIDKLKSLGYL